MSIAWEVPPPATPAVLGVTTGVSVATCTAVPGDTPEALPLYKPPTSTAASSAPLRLDGVENVTVIVSAEVPVVPAANPVTLPAGVAVPSVKVIESLATFGSKP